MLSRIAINFNFEDSYLDGSLRVVRASNILKEGISLAEVNKEILDSDSSVIYSLSTVTNEFGTAWIYNDYFTNANTIQTRYSLKLYDCDKELLFLRQNNLLDSNELKENFLKLFDSFTYYYTAENIKTQKLEADEYPNIVILSCISNFYSNINLDVNDEGLVENLTAGILDKTVIYNISGQNSYQEIMEYVKNNDKFEKDFKYVVLVFELSMARQLSQNLFVVFGSGSICFYDKEKDELTRIFSPIECSVKSQSSSNLESLLKSNIEELASKYIMYQLFDRNFEGYFRENIN